MGIQRTKKFKAYDIESKTNSLVGNDATIGNNLDVSKDITSQNSYIEFNRNQTTYVALSSGVSDFFRQYSTDGLTWTAQTTEDYLIPFIQSPETLFVDGIGFVALGRSKVAAYSTDGITWTPQTISSAGWNSSYNQIAYGDGKFVALCSQYGYPLSATSTDGITWTQTTTPISREWMELVYGDGLFVAVGYGLTISSTDGITWTQSSIPNSNFNSPYLIYGNKFLIMDSFVSYASTDAITWTTSTVSGYSFSTRGLAYADGTFVSMGYPQSFATSTNGITWTRGTLPATISSSPDENMFIYGQGKFVSLSSYLGSSTIQYSTDGSSWTISTIPSQNYHAIVNDGESFVIYNGDAYSGGFSAKSTDLITWTQGTFNTYYVDTAFLVYGNPIMPQSRSISSEVDDVISQITPITSSTTAPTAVDGNDGDVWLTYTP